MRWHLFLGLVLVCTASASAQSPVFGSTSANRLALSADQTVYLESIHGYEGSPQLVTVDTGALGAGDLVSFRLADEVELVMAPDRIERYGDGAFSWFGTMTDDGGVPRGQAVVSVRNGQTIGEFSTPAGFFALKPLGGAVHALVSTEEDFLFESEEAQVRLTTLRVEPSALASEGGSDSARRGGGAAVYRVLFPYTASAEAIVPDIALVAQQSIAYANQSYVNSEVNLRAEFAGLFELDIPETDDLETDLRRLRAVSDGFGDAVHAERQRVGADIVTLFRTADATSTSGIAFVCAQTATSAFGVFEVDGTGTSPVFTHEVGHIIGGGHEQSDSAGCDSFSRAKINGSEGDEVWRTVMYSAFNVRSTIPYFSNPNVSVLGVATGDAGVRENARTFNNRAAVVANFVSVAGPAGVATAQPGSPTVQVLPGTTETVELALENSGAGPFTWYGLTSASPDFTFHTLGEVVEGDLDASGTVEPLVKGSCGSGTALTEGFATVEFPFAFPFNGEAVTQARVSPNGYVVFDDFDGCSRPVPGTIPAAGGPDAYVSAFWSPDIRAVRSGSGTETRVVTTTLDDGRFTVKWLNAGFFIPEISGSFFFVDVQAIFGPDGSVEFRYSDIFRLLVGDSDFTSGETEIDAPLTTNVRVGIEYAPGEGAEVPFARLQSAGQVVFPNPAVELLSASATIGAAQTGTVPVQINADRLPLGEYTIPLQLLTNAPNAPLLEIPIRVQVVTVIDAEDAPRPALEVAPIRPNPAAGEATVSFDLARPSLVVVTVFDALGREVYRRDLGVRIAGADGVSIDTRELAPGAYLVRLEAGDAQRTRRLTVVR